MRCFKLLGERVMARDLDRQVAELQVRAAILNRFTRLGTNPPKLRNGDLSARFLRHGFVGFRAGFPLL